MANYKVIFRVGHKEGDSPILWEEGCPVVFDALQVARNKETGETYLQSRILNICDNVVLSFNAQIDISSKSGSVETVEICPLDAEVTVGGSFEPAPQRLKLNEVESVVIVVKSVQTSSETWESTGHSRVIEMPKSLGLSSEALTERVKQLHENGSIISCDDADHAAKIEDTWWQCACGQVNVNRTCCVSCMSKISLLAQLENEESLVSQSRIRNKAKAKAAKAIVILVSLLVFFSLLGYYAGPRLIEYFGNMTKYNQAEKLLTNGDSLEAFEAFEELGDFQDSADMAVQAALTGAQTALSKDDYVTAIDLYEKIGYADEANAAKYQYAINYFNGADKKTFEYLSQLRVAGYKDSVELYNQLYAWSFEFSTVAEDLFLSTNSSSRYESLFNPESQIYTVPVNERVELLIWATGGVPGGGARLYFTYYYIPVNSITGEWELFESNGTLESSIYVPSGSGVVESISLPLSWPIPDFPTWGWTHSKTIVTDVSGNVLYEKILLMG